MELDEASLNQLSVSVSPFQGIFLASFYPASFLETNTMIFFFEIVICMLMRVALSYYSFIVGLGECRIIIY